MTATVGWRVLAFARALVTSLGLAFAAAGTVVPLLIRAVRDPYARD